MVRQGTRVVEGLVRTKHFKRDFLQEVVNEEPAELVRVPVPMEDAQACFKILRLSTASRLSHLHTESRPSSHIKLLQITTIFWSGRWCLSWLVVEISLPRQDFQPRRKQATIPPVPKMRPIWDTLTYGRPTCPSLNAPLDLPEATQSKAHPLSVATP